MLVQLPDLKTLIDRVDVRQIKFLGGVNYFEDRYYFYVSCEFEAYMITFNDKHSALKDRECLVKILMERCDGKPRLL